MPTTEYTKRYKKYTSTTFSDILPVLKLISLKSESQLKFPVMKVLKAISKKFLLNIFEALHLTFNLIRKWPYYDSFFSQNCGKIKNIIFHQRPEKYYQEILLFLFMNEDFSIYSAELQNTLPNFREILSQFINKYPLNKISLKQLNSIYKMTQETQYFSDYQDIIDNIMHLCTPKSLNGSQSDFKSCENNTPKSKKLLTQNNNNNNNSIIQQFQKSIFFNNFQIISKKNKPSNPDVKQNTLFSQQDFFEKDFQDFFQTCLCQI